MMSWKCQVIIWRWLALLSFSFAAHALKKHYAIDYGDEMGEATVEIDEETHLVSITPFNSTTPATLMNFRKGFAIYVTDTECLVSRLQVSERAYKQQLVERRKPFQNKPSLYVVGSISPRIIRKLLGEELSRFCVDKRTSWLSQRRPRLPTQIFSLNSATADVEASTSLETEHQRSKRGTKKNKKSKERKDKRSKGRRGKDKKSKKDRKIKKPKTKSLTNSAQHLNIKAPRISFPSAYLPSNLTDTTTVLQGSSDHVVLQEEPYLSPSFTREGDDGHGFKHYRDFYQEPNLSNDTRSSGSVSRIISHDISDLGDGDTKILIPETIVKDGQIFYRYDAGESAVDTTKEQSKRSHTQEGDVLDDGGRFDDPYEYHNDSRDSTKDFILSHDTHNSQDESHVQLDYDFPRTYGLPHVQTQAQMGDGIRDASASALPGDGSGIYVQGNSDSEGYFIAQAHSVGHPGERRTNVAHVFGNAHGVLGSAMTNGHGHQSHVKVDMGAHPSSTAHIATHDGSTVLSSSVHATQLSGRAGAQAYGDGASASNAQMEFNPSHSFRGSNGGLRGQGLASATITKSGGSLLTSISGEVAGGSYLGTAHSSISHDPNPSSKRENATLGVYEDYGQIDGVPYEFGYPDQSRDDFSKSGGYQDFIHGRQLTDHVPFSTESFRLINSSSLSVDSGVQSHSDHASEHMIDNIMETVHPPDKHPEYIAYPVSEHSIIDKDTIVGGAGIPPRESEIEQAVISGYIRLPEGVGVVTERSKAGIVGLATYSHGRVGAPPGPGELLNYPLEGSQKYEYSYYDSGYGSDYYTEEYDSEIPQDPRNLPFFDLGAEINGFEPIESNFENFEPMQLGLHDHPVVEQPSLLVDHTEHPLTDPHEYDESGSHEITPDPKITEYQVQAPTLLPDGTLSSDVNVTLTSKGIYDDVADSDNDYHDLVPSPSPDNPIQTLDISTPPPPMSLFPQISATAFSASHANLPEQRKTSQHHSHFETIASEHTVIAPDHQPSSKTRPHHNLHHETPLQLHQPGVTQEPPTVSSFHSQKETLMLPGPQDTSRIQSSHFDLLPDTRSQSFPQRDIQGQGTNVGMMMMMGIPLDPGNPGSVHYLPGNDGGPDLKVMSVAARQDHSLSHQRQRTFLQPGQKIPGAPGYKVPSGFRGHIILGDNLPVSAESRRVVVSGPGNYQQLSQGGVPSGTSHGRTVTGMSRISQHQAQAHSPMRSQPISGTASMPSRQRVGSATPRKSWDGRPGGQIGSQKSWSTSGDIQRVGSDGQCGYYSVNCAPAFGPTDRDQICRPILITIGCCC